MVAYSPLAMRRLLSGSRHCRRSPTASPSFLAVDAEPFPSFWVEVEAQPVLRFECQSIMVHGGHGEIGSLRDLLRLAAPAEVNYVAVVVTASVLDLRRSEVAPNQHLMLLAEGRDMAVGYEFRADGLIKRAALIVARRHDQDVFACFVALQVFGSDALVARGGVRNLNYAVLLGQQFQCFGYLFAGDELNRVPEFQALLSPDGRELRDGQAVS
jgi:hypothetical protein